MGLILFIKAIDISEDGIDVLADNAYGFALGLGSGQLYPCDRIVEILKLTKG